MKSKEKKRKEKRFIHQVLLFSFICSPNRGGDHYVCYLANKDDKKVYDG